MNHSFLRSNQTGYIGVYYSKSSERYEAKVGYKGKRIFLGSVKKESEITKLAQMYNIAASFLFGPFTGSLNETPSPDEKLIQYVQTKCRKYKEERNEYFNINAACVS